MKLNYIALAIPLFLFFIGLEYYYAKRKGKNFFQYAESIANLNVGIAERLLDVFTVGIFFYVFDYIQKNAGIFQVRASFLTWFLLFVLTDLVWYWYHRLAHEINAFWAVHVVHHQSEDFNYTVSARITVFQAAVRCLFWSVLPLFGFPAVMVTTLLLIHGLYPFFIHTRTIGKLGWLEYIFVTPRHHSVHHASNPEYLDKNYGDVLIIWDKLFGTFAEEKESVKPVYGLTKQLNSHSFLWQHFHFPLELLLAVRMTKGWRAKVRILFGKPADMNPECRGILEKKLINVNTENKPTATMRQYITAQTIFSLGLLFVLVLFEKYFSAWQLALISAFIIVSLVNSGAILDQRRWIFYLELIRILLVMVLIVLIYRNAWINFSVTIAILLLVFYFRPIRRRYIHFLYEK